MKALKSSLLLLAVLLLIAACGKPSYPAITTTPSNQYRYGDVVWRDLVTTRPDQVVSFYGDLFGWKITEVKKGKYSYYTISNNGNLIGGILHPADRSDDKGSEWVSMISVESVARTSVKVNSSGGMVYGENFEVKGRGEMALISDPSSAFLGLLHAEGGDPVSSAAANGDWLWTELWSDNPESVISFYESFGLTISKETKGGNDYYLMKSGDELVASMLKNPIENWRSLWVPYVKVDNAKAMAEKAASLGGKVVVAPSDDVRDSSIAVVMDPGGALFVMQEWNK